MTVTPMHTQRVLLVKEPHPSHDDDEGKAQRDAYDTILTASGRFTVDFLPALSHAYTHLDELASIIRGGFPYSGVVFTSQRAVQAYGRAWRLAEGTSERLPSTTAATAMRIPFYTVGPATAASLGRELPQSAIPPPELILGAAESGNAEKLAHFILSHRSSRTEEEERHTQAPLLYLVGDKRKDTLSRLLSAADVPVRELQVYETFPSPTFAQDWDNLTSGSSRRSSAIPCRSSSLLPFDWIVFFSPSGAKLLLPLLPPDATTWPRIAAIGPTTRDYLASALMQRPSSDTTARTAIDVAAMAESPKPEALLQALLAAEAKG